VRVPLSWLREFCPTPLSAEELADLLTNHGVEVERVIRPWEMLSGVLVARVLGVADHPNADKLCLATVDAGSGERQVVVGVRNMGAGDLVPYAPPGATLPGAPQPLERREIRGVASEGMLCSPKELGLSGDHSAILVFADGAEPGGDLKAALGLDESVLDVEVFPNRPDLLSVLGVAREVAAVTGGDLRPPDTSVKESDERAEEAATVEVLDEVRCPRYVARVIRGVRIAPSPLEAQVRLSAAGMRPLAGVVDATNYAMLELGQPLHPFDLARLAGPGIVVRTATEGELLTTLDDAERSLTAEDLLICDVERPVAVAGVMGGATSEVGEGTTDVLLEAAHFDPMTVARTSRRMGLRTEASIRFERGVDPEGVAPAAARASALMAAWAGGTVLAGEVDVGEVPPRRRLSVRPSRARMLLGVELSPAGVREALGRYRLPMVEEGDDRIDVEVPGHRVDLAIEADLIEEVGRITGYGDLPSTLPGIRQAGGLTTEQRIHRRIQDVLSATGLWEVISFSFAPHTDLELFEDERRTGVRIANPISDEESYLRSSLIPGLLRAARRNLAQHRASIRLFEIGKTFIGRDGETEEIDRLAVLMTGSAAEEWPGERRPVDFLDTKGVLEDLLSGLGIEEWALSELSFSPFHPGRSAEVILPGQPPVGELAEIHPLVAERFDLPGRVALLELRVQPLVVAASADIAFRDLSRFPPLRRDLAFVVDADAPAGAVRAALQEAAGDILDRVLLFDVYRGDPLPEGKKSLAFSVDFRAPDRTLTDAEADARVRLIAERLGADFGAELRAG
jgi:phenylalanyl-tRNA synthetase beta chain